MKRILPTALFILLFSTLTYAQRKSELIAEIETLKVELDSIKNQVIVAQKNEKVSTIKAESFQVQVKELQSANATLLKNLNSFATISSKNSENVNKAMASLEAKENQLKDITTAISSNDSTAIVVLTNAKQTLGENAKISVSNGAVVIAESLTNLFGEDTTKTEVITSAEAYLEKIANVMNANPGVMVTIEGLSMTGELDLATRQAAAVAGVLQKKFSIASDRIAVLGKDGNFKEGIHLKLHPKYDQFYMMVRESIKH